MVGVRRLFPLLLSLLVVLAAAPARAQDRSVTLVSGSLYRAADGARTTMFLVGSDGIILLDPLGYEFAQWLKDDLAARFPGRRVKHVIYTHVDFDRLAGGGVFNDSAEIAAVEGLNDVLSRSRLTLPPRLAPLDVNTSGVLEQSELVNYDRSAALMRLDRNGDGHLTSAELWSGIPSPKPSSTFRGRRSITVGGASVELLQPGPAMGLDATVCYFPNERYIFVPELPSMTSPFAGRAALPADLVAWTSEVNLLDFDTMLSGTGDAATHAQLRDLSTYLTALVSGVTNGYERGRSVAEIQQGSTIDRFSGTPLAGSRDADIAYIYRRTKLATFDVYGAGLYQHASHDLTLCNGGMCTLSTQEGPGGMVGAAVSIRRWRLGGEASFGPQFTGTAINPLTVTSLSMRDTLISGLVGIRTSPGGTFNLSVVGGVTVAMARKQVVAKFGTTTSAFASDTQQFGFTFGGDLTAPLGDHVRLVIPVRATTLQSEPGQLFATTFSVRVGVGISVILFRRAM